MADKNETLKLISMNEAEAAEIDWLRYLYIPYGKITVIQGWTCHTAFHGLDGGEPPFGADPGRPISPVPVRE